ncbi:TM2 domain-containing protein [Romboutsia maritimum]|nr:TM2 domain-containing protein [Romboutsia maritimum]
MYCKNCKRELKENDQTCANCGVKVGEGNKFCQICSEEIKENAIFCASCGKPVDVNYTEKIDLSKDNYSRNEKKIYCRNCANEMTQDAAVCIKCGFKKGNGNNYCSSCGGKTNENADVCINCGAGLNNKKIYSLNGSGSKSKLIAVLLCIFLGTLGIHRFYVGDNTKGFVILALTLGGVLTCGITAIISCIWVIVDLILIILDEITDENGFPLEW